MAADERADMEKGTGCVKITPTHDQTILVGSSTIWKRVVS